MDKVKIFSICFTLLCLGIITGIVIKTSTSVGVVYLQDYDCSMKYTHAKEELNAYASVLHRIWLDNPSYVEDVLTETDEFCTLDSVTDFGNIFEFWSDKDSVEYHNNTIRQQIEAEVYLHHYREPDELPTKAQ